MFGKKNKEVPVVELGDLAEDRISGFKGVVECETNWLNSCVRITLRPTVLQDGKPIDNQTFDIHQVRVIEAGYYDKPVIEGDTKTGGPCSRPASHKSPV